MNRLDRVYQLWDARPCFQCRAAGRCGHRELEVDLALIEAEDRRAEIRVDPDPRQLPLPLVLVKAAA